MEHAGKKGREIHFYSEKNEKLVCVHSEAAREYAAVLEKDAAVRAYEAGKELDRERYRNVLPVDIRKEYFDTSWLSDFAVSYVDGRIGVCEIVSEAALEKRATIEKLEFSRRYWAAAAADSWKLIVIGKGV